MEKNLTVLGSINADHVISVPYFAKPGETLTGSHYRINYGGKGANQAVAAARLGGNVSFISCIGDDDIGRAMKNAFAQDGIDIHAITQVEGEMTGIAMIQVSETGENSIVLSTGANGRLDPSRVEHFAQEIKQADYLLMQLETPLAGVMTAAALACQSQTKVVLNPAPAQLLPDELLRNVDIITPNETEAEILTGVKVGDQAGALKAAQVFHAKGIQTVLITLGAKGVFYSQQGKGEIIAGFKVAAKDTTGAGDTFNGGLVVALLEGQPIDDAIRFAQAAAAISVTRTGAQSSIPIRSEVLAFLQSV
ncbi:ribokinase [Pasteurellaceae bacterium LIM206]|nr:ribokinase [Pasteurellaceae bacterium LIM206]